MAWQDAVNIYAPVIAASIAAIAWTVRLYKRRQRRLKNSPANRNQDTSID